MTAPYGISLDIQKKINNFALCFYGNPKTLPEAGLGSFMIESCPVNFGSSLSLCNKCT